MKDVGTQEDLPSGEESESEDEVEEIEISDDDDEEYEDDTMDDECEKGPCSDGERVEPGSASDGVGIQGTQKAEKAEVGEIGGHPEVPKDEVRGGLWSDVYDEMASSASSDPKNDRIQQLQRMLNLARKEQTAKTLGYISPCLVFVLLCLMQNPFNILKYIGVVKVCGYFHSTFYRFFHAPRKGKPEYLSKSPLTKLTRPSSLRILCRTVRISLTP